MTEPATTPAPASRIYHNTARFNWEIEKPRYREPSENCNGDIGSGRWVTFAHVLKPNGERRKDCTYVIGRGSTEAAAIADAISVIDKAELGIPNYMPELSGMPDEGLAWRGMDLLRMFTDTYGIKPNAAQEEYLVALMSMRPVRSRQIAATALVNAHYLVRSI
jgi:hypothetical protein